jgi:hypothetical protein
MMKKKPEFGSVKWQNMEMKRITKKIMKSEPLDTRDIVFLDVQHIHNQAIMKKYRRRKLRKVI